MLIYSWEENDLAAHKTKPWLLQSLTFLLASRKSDGFDFEFTPIHFAILQGSSSWVPMSILRTPRKAGGLTLCERNISSVFESSLVMAAVFNKPCWSTLALLIGHIQWGWRTKQSKWCESYLLITFGWLLAFRPLLCNLQGHKGFPAVPDHKTRFPNQLSLTTKIKHSPLPSGLLKLLFLLPCATCSHYCKNR